MPPGIGRRRKRNLHRRRCACYQRPDGQNRSFQSGRRRVGNHGGHRRGAEQRCRWTASTNRGVSRFLSGISSACGRCIAYFVGARSGNRSNPGRHPSSRHPIHTFNQRLDRNFIRAQSFLLFLSVPDGFGHLLAMFGISPFSFLGLARSPATF
jgi:hypothetical protein